jgi:hypothetical protein
MRETHKNIDNDGVINPNPEQHEKKNCHAIFNPSKAGQVPSKAGQVRSKTYLFSCLSRFSLSLNSAFTMRS